MTNTISDKTKIQLFVVIGALAVIIPATIKVTFWFAELRNDTNQVQNKNTEQDGVIKEVNEKLSLLHTIDGRLQTIESVLKIKKEASLERPQTTTNN